MAGIWFCIIRMNIRFFARAMLFRFALTIMRTVDGLDSRLDAAINKYDRTLFWLLVGDRRGHPRGFFKTFYFVQACVFPWIAVCRVISIVSTDLMCLALAVMLCTGISIPYALRRTAE